MERHKRIVSFFGMLSSQFHWLEGCPPECAACLLAVESVFNCNEHMFRDMWMHVVPFIVFMRPSSAGPSCCDRHQFPDHNAGEASE